MINSVRMPSRHDFATLDIILPSARESENFILEHNGKKVQFQNNGCSEWDCSFLSWFTDVSMNSTKLSSDRRLILRYNLQHTLPGETSSAKSLEASISNLQSILEPWIRDGMLVPKNVLGYVLSKNYQSGISLQNLCGKDILVVNQLKEVCTCTGSNFELYLSRIEKQASGPTASSGYGYYGYGQSGDENHVMEEVEEESLHITKLVNLNGEALRADAANFDYENLINDDPFDGASTDEEDYDDDDGYMTKHYRASMVVLIPRASRFQFILGKLGSWDNDRNECVLKYMADLGNITSESSSADWEEMKKVCELVLARSESDRRSNVLSGFSYKVYLLVISSIIDLDDKVLLERTLPTCFSGPEYQPLVAKLREKNGPLWVLASGIRAELYISTVRNFANRCETIETLSQYQVETGWSFTQYELALSSCAPSLCVSDVAQLIKVAKVLPEKRIIETLETLNPRDWPGDISFAEGQAGYDSRYPPDSAWPQRKYWNVAFVVCRAYQRGMTLELELFFRRLCHQVQSAQLDSFNDKFMPFLKALVDSIRNVIPIAFKAPLFKQLFQTIVSSYAIRYHADKPVKPQGWTRDIRGCNSNCSDCNLLDEALLDPTRKKFVFYLNAQRRQHLESRIFSDVQNRLIKTSVVKDRSPHGLVMEKTGDVFAHIFRIWSLLAKETMLRIEMLGEDVIEILSEEHDETPLRGMAKVSDDNIQQAKKDIATIISKHRATSKLQESSSSKTLASSSSNTISGTGIGEKRGFSSDISATSENSVSYETQAKRLPAWNQWREPTKE
ncbi:hypothetical protein ACHAP3_003155 [Botrytis cinerea]